MESRPVEACRLPSILWIVGLGYLNKRGHRRLSVDYILTPTRVLI